MDPAVVSILNELNISEDSRTNIERILIEEEINLQALAGLNVAILRELGVKVGPASSLIVKASNAIKRGGSRKKLKKLGKEFAWKADQSIWFTPVPRVANPEPERKKALIFAEEALTAVGFKIGDRPGLINNDMKLKLGHLLLKKVRALGVELEIDQGVTAPEDMLIDQAWQTVYQLARAR